jgi:1-acylglycerone phosphate reductase
VELKRRGLAVFATGRTLDKISDLKELGIECVVLSVDDPASVALCHEAVAKKLDGCGLDFLFNNAGLGTYTHPTNAVLLRPVLQLCFAQPPRPILTSARPCSAPMCLVL